MLTSWLLWLICAWGTGQRPGRGSPAWKQVRSWAPNYVAGSCPGPGEAWCWVVPLPYSMVRRRRLWAPLGRVSVFCLACHGYLKGALHLPLISTVPGTQYVLDKSLNKLICEMNEVIAWIISKFPFGFLIMQRSTSPKSPHRENFLFLSLLHMGPYELMVLVEPIAIIMSWNMSSGCMPYTHTVMYVDYISKVGGKECAVCMYKQMANSGLYFSREGKSLYLSKSTCLYCACRFRELWAAPLA